METAFRKEQYECMVPVWSGTATRETAEEQVVPDTMPDIGSIIDAEGVLTVRGKETQTGVVQMSASVSVSVVYMPEGGGMPRCLEITLPADLRMDADGADGDCVTTAAMRVRGLEARAVNSRKVSVRAEVEGRARCWKRAGRELACDLVEEGSGAHVLVRSLDIMPVSDVREKTFAVTDEYQLPMGEGLSILSRRADAVVDDVKYVSGKAVFRGRVCSELLFAAPESERVSSMRYETEFSQIMEIGSDAAEAMPEITLLLTGAYFDLPEFGGGNGRLSAEFHLAAQCVCREKRTISYIADIYSNRAELSVQTEPLTVVTDARPVTMRQTVAGQAEAFSGGEIVRVSACTGGASVDGNTVKTSVSVRLMCRGEDGAYSAVRCRMPAEFTFTELPADARLDEILVTAADVYANAGSGGAEVRAALQLDASVVTQKEMPCVSAAETDEQSCRPRDKTPSVTLVRVPAGTELWDIARRYHSTTEAISAANEGRQDGLLLIPKGR